MFKLMPPHHLLLH